VRPNSRLSWTRWLTSSKEQVRGPSAAVDLPDSLIKMPTRFIDKDAGEMGKHSLYRVYQDTKRDTVLGGRQPCSTQRVIGGI